jgi:beta-barrel assembly-enhancing protease
MKKLSIYFSLLLLALFTAQCDKNNDAVFFSIENDKELGRQTDSAVKADPAQFPLLAKSSNQEAYTYLQNIVNKILNSGELTYRDEFVWEVNIIDDSKLPDRVLNAFATPGGYIYVYSGLIKYLDKEDDLAGVLGHEIAHADQRHSMKQIRDQYGLSVALSIILGQNPSQLAQIVGGITGQLATLKFSRNHEAEADEYSVKYLSKTNYACNSAASFFRKLIAEGQTGGTPEFLSTHPNPESRVDDIDKQAQERGCSTTPAAPGTFSNFKNMLP